MQPVRKTIVLGDEYDARLRAAALGVFRELGAVPSRRRARRRSQRVERFAVEIGGKALVLEAETHMGLSVCGDADLVEEVAALVSERMESRVGRVPDLRVVAG